MLKQYYLGCLSHASYMLWDPEAKTAMVVDPQRDIQQYRDDAAELGVSIDKVVLTHFHADFIAGHLELAAATGAEIVMGVKAATDFPMTKVTHGTTWTYPTMTVKVLESPGHTPEMINLLVTDTTDPEAPQAVLTGDTLFNGDVGRPDLLASRGVTADELANMLFDSVQMLKALPDDTLVYPAHGAGSMCGKALADETVSTIGAQKATNYAMRLDERETFVAAVTADQEQPPAYFAYNADLNRHERGLLSTTLETLRALEVDTVIRRANEGAQVVDTRDDQAFSDLHLPGTINIGLDGTYATWCGTVLDPKRPIVIVAAPGKEQESAMRLGRIGYDHIEGYLHGGFPALADARPELLETRQRLVADQFPDFTGIVLDVRSPGERAGSLIPGSLHIPLAQLPCRTDEVPRDRPVLVHCAGGYRSSLAASLLRKHGHTGVTDLAGGINAYEAAGHPTTMEVNGIQQVGIDMITAFLDRGVPLVDVREPDEWDQDRIPGAILRPLSRLPEWADEFTGQEVLFSCRSGNRSQQVAQALAPRVQGHNLAGGILAYRAAHPETP